MVFSAEKVRNFDIVQHNIRYYKGSTPKVLKCLMYWANDDIFGFFYVWHRLYWKIFTWNFSLHSCNSFSSWGLNTKL
jgi:hypothetical protein